MCRVGVATAGEWADHIESAEDQLGVERTAVRVRGIERDDSGWTVSTTAGDVDADVVVVATGRNRVPEIPDWPGRDTTGIDVLHASAYRNPDRFIGRRVLVVGAGNSGTEIAHLLRSAGVEVTLSMRTRSAAAATQPSFRGIGRNARQRIRRRCEGATDRPRRRAGPLRRAQGHPR